MQFSPWDKFVESEMLMKRSSNGRSSLAFRLLTMVLIKGGLLLVLCLAGLQHGSSTTDPQDVAALISLSANWKNTPPHWANSGDPCGDNWEGINCTGSRISQLKLFNMGLEGTLSSDIGSLPALTILDLSYNPNLGGPLPQSIGNLKNLTTLRLIACKFDGYIPNEVGNLEHLSVLALNSNQFSGKIPASIGKLSNLVWLDLASNQLNGTLPTSGNGSPGLDQLVMTQHFHLNENQFSGSIPENLFSSSMTVKHLLLDSNNLVGKIPESIALVQTLKVIRLDKNSLNGSVPSLNNLTRLYVLNLANNKLTGPMPNLTRMDGINYLDLSNNSFDPSVAPSWLSDLHNLTALIIEYGGLQGEVPELIFSFPKLQEVRLRNNDFNGTLSLGSNISNHLKNVDFQNNAITFFIAPSNYTGTLILMGNPVCTQNNPIYAAYCNLQQENLKYDFLQDVICWRPYEVQMVFRAPYFHDITYYVGYLDDTISAKLNQTPVKYAIHNVFFSSNSYLQVQVKVCPSNATHFTRAQILDWLEMSSQSLVVPEEFGPYYPDPSSYPFGKKVSLSAGVIAGIIIASLVMVCAIIILGVYALRKKKQAKEAIALTNPFASWGSNDEDTGGAPQLKSTRFFPYDELRKCTSGFSKFNEIGSGGYGKVYKGILPDGEIVAVKRSQKGSTQGGLEFKTEIELLSRVHHKNLVRLLGFCFEKGERTLVYEYISNGTLRDNLSGETNMRLDWKRRLKIALDSARGLAYLHEFANPPIIHRDIKSTNILLDKNLTAKVADFGLSKLVSDCGEDQSHVSTTVKGTLGYLDPEYFMTQQLTPESDVYSFGVVMLELITATLPIHKGKYIVQEVKMAKNKNNQFYGLKDIMDPLLVNEGNLVGFEKFVELALKCVQDSGENRPAMNDIVKEIEMMLKTYGSTTSSASVSSSTIHIVDVSKISTHEMFPSVELGSEDSYDSEKYLLSERIHHGSLSG